MLRPNSDTTPIKAYMFLLRKVAIEASGPAIPVFILFTISSKATANWFKAWELGSMRASIAPNLSSAWDRTSLATAWLLSKAVRSLAVLFKVAAYFLVAGSSLKIIPNSSNSSGSALVTPLINLSKESAKSLPSTIETFFAALAKPFNCVGLSPEAVPIAAALAASAYLSCPLVAAINPSDIVL